MASHTEQGIRWQRVAGARALVASGFYDDPDVFHDLLERCVDRLLKDLDACEVGDGDRYRDIVANILARSFEDLVDVAMMQKEVKIEGGRADIEIPLRIERLHEYPLWQSWQSTYEIRSILVETKNLRRSARYRDVSQIIAYLRRGDRGRFGILVSRNGFSKGALTVLQSLAREYKYLVLPLANDDLRFLLRLSDRGPEFAMEFLRRKELVLIQAA